MGLVWFVGFMLTVLFGMGAVVLGVMSREPVTCKQGILALIFSTIWPIGFIILLYKAAYLTVNQ